MKLISKFIAAGIVLAGTTFAHATTLSGIIGMSSTASAGTTETTTSTGITFNPSGTGAARVSYGTGDFVGLTAGDTINLTNIVFANLNGNGGQHVFNFVDKGNTYQYDAMFYTVSGSLYIFTGTLYENSGVINANSIFYINPSTGGAISPDTFSSSNVNPSATPEPDSLVLLGTGLISAAGFAMRKRRAV